MKFCLVSLLDEWVLLLVNFVELVRFMWYDLLRLVLILMSFLYLLFFFCLVNLFYIKYILIVVNMCD